LGGESQPASAEAHPQVWARVEIAKPAKASEPVPVVAAAELTLPPPTLTLPSPTLEASVVQPLAEPTATPTLPSPTSTSEPDPTAIPEATSTPAGSLVLEIVEDTPVPTPRPADENAAPTAKPQQPPVGNGVRWIEVNLSEQRVYAWEGDVLMNSFIVSTGTWATPTVVGTFQIWNKTRIQTMSGPGYSLPNVPWVMYFYKDYGFHGTYWHNNFGTPMSHGCVNLTIPDSEWLYNWASYGTTVKVHY
jgi:lipoprotein-anchoring transpeptidase ErfK/SrfK